LLIAATGSSTAIPEVLAACGPDGFAGLSLPADRVVLPDAPPGALIGRFGGSSASLKADGAFPIGLEWRVSRSQSAPRRFEIGRVR
jgi:hypothetical protein